jgi:phage major head subunit gpT-like protein
MATIITSQVLDSIRVGFKTIFQKEMEMAKPMWDQISEIVISTAGEEKYGFLGEVAAVREWIGPRVVNQMKEFDYAIKNKSFEHTIGVPREKIEDDLLGQFNMRARMQSRQIVQFNDRLIWPLLKAGFTTNCYDGQFFFDIDHPVIGEDGTMGVQANTDGGAGAYWFLVADEAPLKPIIFQKRKEWEYAALDNLTDANVFMNKEFFYGIDGRCNAGYGFWQGIWGSRQPLTAANYALARAVLGSRKGDHGVLLGFANFKLYYAPSLESDALKLLNTPYGAGGISNEWNGTAVPVKVPWLA